jgi:hypothetical protein
MLRIVRKLNHVGPSVRRLYEMRFRTPTHLFWRNDELRRSLKDRRANDLVNADCKKYQKGTPTSGPVIEGIRAYNLVRMRNLAQATA